MPKRFLPNSTPKRYEALKAVNDRKAVTPPANVPLTAATIAWLDTFFAAYKTKYLAISTAITAQTDFTAQVLAAKTQATFYIADMIDALQNAVRRGQFNASVRGLYGLPVSHSLRPEIISEQDVLTWGERVHDGEAARIAAGGAPITFPSLAQVDAAVDAFKNLNLQQAAAKDDYDNALEAMEADVIEADKLILKLWNEIETAFDTGNKPSMRRKAREWGVFYLPTPGEELSPDEFSLTGKISDSISSHALNDVVVRAVEADVIVVTDNKGNYYMPLLPPGTYTLQLVKTGYVVKEIPGVVVEAGVVATVNAQLAANTPASTGTISGVVLQNGNPYQALLTVIAGSGTYTTHTQADGSYLIIDIPTGGQTITCTPDSDPANLQNMVVTVPAGGNATANFSYV